MNPISASLKSSRHPWRIALGVWMIISLACSLPGLGGKSTPLPPEPTAAAPTARALPNLPPALVETNPLPASEIGLLAPLTLYFNQPMVRESVQAALSLSPAVEGVFDWLDDATLRFTPKNPLPVDSQVSLTVGKDAQAQNGIRFTQEARVVYHTPSALQVTQKIPAPNSLEVNPVTPVVVAFNRPVVPLQADEGNAGPQAFRLEPRVEGKGSWLNTSTYIFHPARGLAGGTTYTVRMDPELTSLEGPGLADDQLLEWSFSTSLPSVIAYAPASKSRILLQQEFSIEFNQPMDRASVAENLSLRSVTGETFGLELTWENNDSRVVFKPVELLPRDTTVFINLAGEAAAPSGAPLGQTFYTEYATVPDFAVEATDPAEGQSVNYYSGYVFVSLRFTSPVADEVMDAYVTIEPSVQNFNVFRSYDGWNINLNGYMEPASAYTVTLSPELKDIYGQALGVPYTWTFNVSPAAPGFSIPVVYNAGYSVFLEPNEPVVSAQVTNVETLQMSGGAIDLAPFVLNVGTYDDSLLSVPIENPRVWTQTLNIAENRSVYVDVPLTPSGGPLPTGTYLFKVRVPELDTRQNQFVLPFLAAISNVNLTIKATTEEALVWAVDLRTQTPLANEEVTFYSPMMEDLGSAVTNAEGLAVFAFPTGSYMEYNDLIAVTGQPGQPEFGITRRGWSYGINGWDFGIPAYELTDKAVAYFYTDRPIYRPGQEVFFRAVLNERSGWQYLPYEGETVTVTMTGEYDPVSDSVPELGETSLTVSRFGTISGEFTLPENAQPGYYALRIKELDYDAVVNFQVANYRKPEFELNVTFPAEELQAGQDIRATISADYYFGAPAGNLPVTWILYAASEWFDLPGGYQVGKIDNSWLRWDWMWDGMGGLFGNQILSGSGQTDPNGKLVLDFDWQDLSQRFDAEVLSTLTLEVSGMDESNFTISGRGGLRLHPADRYIGIRPEAWGVQAGSEAGFAIQTVDWLKNPVATRQLSAVFSTVRWVSSGGNSAFGFPIYEPEFTEIASTNFGTDARGSARIAFTPPDPGTYMLEVRGNGAVSQIYVWVGGAGSSEWPTLPNQHLRLEADAETYQPGQTAQVFIPNPFPGGALALITLEQDRVQRWDVIEINDSSLLYDIPLSDADAPNVYVSVTLIGRQADGRADFRMGIVNLNVEPSALLLSLNLTADPAQAGPGDEVTFSLVAKDREGNPVQGEFSLSVVDKAVLALADPNAPPIDRAFYAAKPLGVVTGISLLAYGRRIVPTEAGGRGGGGGGDMAESLAVERSNYKDTAYWTGLFETSAEGLAEVSFTLPDNLTTWVATARGLTENMLVGETSIEVIASKELLLRPATPRFLVAGDRVELATLVQNNTNRPLTVDVSIQVVGVDLDDPGQMMQQINLPAGGRQRVAWRGQVQLVESVDVLFRAVNETYQDAARPERNPIPVLRFSSPQTYGTSGVLAEPGEITEVVSLPRTFTPTGGELRVEMAPSMAAMILKGLDALEAYPYTYPEGVLSRLLPNLETYRTLTDLGMDDPELKTRLEDAIRDGLAKLKAQQVSDGGWGWYFGNQSDLYLTAYVVYGLNRAVAAGVSVDEMMLRRGITYLVGKFEVPAVTAEDWEIDRQVFVAFALAEGGREVNTDGLYDLRDRLSPWAKAMLAMTLQKNNPEDARIKTLTSDLEGAAVRSASGAFWQEEDATYRNLSTPNFNSALVLTLLARVNPASPLVGDAVRYLSINRNVRGGWLSSYETAWVLMSLTEVLRGTGELQAVYEFSAAVNGTPVANGVAGGLENINLVSARLPLTDLAADAPNALTIFRNGTAGRLYYRAFLQVFRPVEDATPINRGLTIERQYYLNWADCQQAGCTPVESYSLAAEDSPVVVRVNVVVPNDLYQVVVEDSLPAGAEIIDRSLNTAQQGESTPSGSVYSPFDPLGGGWGWWWFNSPKVYDDHIQWVAEYLPAGTYTLTYEFMPAHVGEFQVIPAHAYMMYFPDVEGLSAGSIFRITP